MPHRFYILSKQSANRCGRPLNIAMTRSDDEHASVNKEGSVELTALKFKLTFSDNSRNK